MNALQLELPPFFTNASTGVKVCYGFSSFRNKPIVVKSYECRTKSELNHHFQEARNMSRIEHPHICMLFDALIDTQDPMHGVQQTKDRLEPTNTLFVVLVMERLVSDASRLMQDREANSEYFTEVELRNFLRQTAEGLAFAHAKVRSSKGVAHGDLKPDNIFVDERGEYKVGDFGSFWMKRFKDTTPNPRIGALNYASPQMRMVSIDSLHEYNPIKSDVYSLGVTIIKMATFTIPEDMWTIDPTSRASAYTVNSLPFSADFKHILLRMLSFEESTRASLHEVLSLLQPKLYAQAPPAPRSTPDSLVFVTKLKAHRFSVTGKLWEEMVTFTGEIPVDSCTSSLVVGTGNVFACGGGPEPRKSQPRHRMLLNRPSTGKEGDRHGGRTEVSGRLLRP